MYMPVLQVSAKRQCALPAQPCNLVFEPRPPCPAPQRSALHIASTAYLRNATAYGTSAQWRDSKEGQLITNNTATILNAIFTSLDDVVQVRWGTV